MRGKIAIVGTGTMGNGITIAALGSDYNVVLIAHSERFVASAMERLNESMDKAVAKGKMTKEQKETCLGNLKLSSNMNDIADSEIIIETVPENLKTKQGVLKSIEGSAGKSAIIVTCTSSISISKLSEPLKNPGRFMGVRFLNPAPVIKLVEAIPGSKTSNETVEKAKAFAEGMGKTMVIVKDTPGFIANRMLMVFINEAVLALDQGVATKEDIDTIAKLGFNHPMGPLELADFIGLDVCKDIMDVMYEQGGEERFKPAGMLVKMVNEGKLGRKSGKGFYDYPKK